MLENSRKKFSNGFLNHPINCSSLKNSVKIFYFERDWLEIEAKKSKILKEKDF